MPPQPSTPDLPARPPASAPRKGPRRLRPRGPRSSIVATDRISAFDVVLSPGHTRTRASVLTQLSTFWFRKFDGRRAEPPPRDRRRRLPGRLASHAALLRRARRPREEVPRRPVRVRRPRLSRRLGLEGLPGDRRRLRRSRCPPGFARPTGSPSRSSRRPRRPRVGHDENVSFATMADALGSELAATPARPDARASTPRAAAYAESRGILVADTKFEFGLDDGRPASSGSTRRSPPTPRASGPRATLAAPAARRRRTTSSFVRDWLETTGWDKTPPAPVLPPDVVAGTLRPLRRGVPRPHGRRARSCRPEGHRRPREELLDARDGGHREIRELRRFRGVSRREGTPP